MFTTFDTRIPVPKIRYARYWDASEVFVYWFGILMLTLLVGFGVATEIRLAHPPKVVTKTVVSYATPLSQAETTFIKDCENSENNSRDHGVPNTSVTPWSCQYADK